MSHGKIGVCAWRFSARLFHYVHPLVLANVMHECTYRTLASHADTCRLDFYQKGVHSHSIKAISLLLSVEEEAWLALEFINTTSPTALPCICSTSTIAVVIVAAMALMVPRGDPSDQDQSSAPCPQSADATRPDEIIAAAQPTGKRRRRHGVAA